jgi:hypothetical protein
MKPHKEKHISIDDLAIAGILWMVAMMYLLVYLMKD